MAIPIPPDGPEPPAIIPNPLQNLTDDALFAGQLALSLACGRNRGILRSKHRNHLCYLANILNVEATNRGKPAPVPPYKA